MSAAGDREVFLFPASPAQRRLWFIERLRPGTGTYNIPFALRLEGRLDAAVLERCLEEVVARHEALRTRFEEDGGEVSQVVYPPEPVPLDRVDLRGRPHDLADACAAVVDAPFDLERDPPLRARLFRLGDQEHLVLIVFHHIAVDGWSVGVLSRELIALYAAFAAGRPSPLPEPRYQYVDYSEWHRDFVASDEVAAQLAYWREALAGSLAATALPADRERPPSGSARGATLDVELPAALVAALAAHARREGATLFMALLSGLAVLLHRYSGARDVIVGTPVANRPRPELEEVVGFFVNTVAIRVRIDPAMTSREALAEVRRATLGAFDHQDVPFDRVVEELRLPRDLSHSPVFQVLLALQNQPMPRVELAGLRVTPVEIPSRVAKFDLALSTEERGGALAVHVEYSSELFEADTARRIVSHLERVLEQLAAHPDRRIDDIDPIGPEERDKVLRVWNRTEADYPRDRLVHEWFEAQAERTPDAVAVRFRGAELTYGELRRAAAELAAELVELGVGPGVPVAISLERSIWMVVGLLGALEAGGAFFPLDPGYPPSRWTSVLQQSGAPVVLTVARTAAGLPAHAGSTIQLDRPRARPAPDRSRRRRPHPDDLAYLVYTSGSTGGPKGVAMSHRSHTHLLAWQTASSRAGLGTRTLQFAALSFDVSFQEIFSTLATGGTLVIADEEVRRDGEALLAVLADERIERLFTPVVVLHNLAAVAARRAGIALSLREVLAAGEQLRVTDDVRALLARLPGCRMVNHYGPTETHALSWWEQEDEVPVLPPIGRPLPRTRIYLLDERLRPTPIGVPGELHAAGDGLARGYLARPDQTASRFVPDPFGPPGSRMYRTGDLARHRADGTLDYLGRRDHQTKVRGYRVELGEVEAALAAHPGVRECTVVARDDGHGKALVGYLVPAGPAPAADELRGFLRARLPEFMVPTAFVALDALPLTANRKIDRAALPAPAAAPLEATAPLGEREALVAGLFAELLGQAPPDVAASFFELGGHSLLATRLASRLREATGHDLPLKVVFERSSVRELAAYLDAQAAVAGGPPPIRPVGRDHPLPLSFAQQRLWFLDRLETGSAFYNMPFAVELTGALDHAALAAAVRALVQRHEVLRSVLVEIDGQPRQRVTDGRGIELERVSLRDVPERERERRALALAQHWSERPFDLARGPLVRFHVIDLAAERAVLVAALHHAVADGWSVPILTAELTELYRAALHGRPPALAPLPVQYGDYAAWQRTWAEQGGLDGQVRYWREALAGELPVLELPRDRPRPARQRYRGRAITRELPAGVAAAVERIGRAAGTTAFMTLLAGFSALLHRLTGQRDVLIGTPISGRRSVEVEGLIGCFINTLVIRTRPEPDARFEALLDRVRAACLDAYANQDVPFEQLVEVLQPVRSTQHTPLFQAMFVYNQQPGELERFGPLGARALEVETGTSTFDLTFTVTDVAGRLLLAAEYDTDLFDAGAVAGWMAAYEALLCAALDAPVTPIGRLPLLDEVTRARVLGDWNEVDDPAVARRPLGRLFEDQVAATPDAPALLLEERALTYRQLDAAAGAIARRLADLGVGPEVTVGVCLERSFEMIAAVIAVEKAGGAYVPLDPALPAERMAYMLGDARVRAVVTQPALAERLPAGPWTRLIVGGLETDGAHPVSDPLLRRDDPDLLAYVMYTSGSTGRPKGVMVAHAQVHARLAMGQAAYPLGPGSRVLQVASLSFDPSVLEIFTALTTGAALVLLPPGAHRDPAAIARHIRERRVTSLELVPSMLDLVLEEGAFGPETSVRRVYVGGEAIPLELMHRFLERSRVELVNTYGPTEATVDTVHWVCRRRAGLRSVPIGRPIERSQAYVLDRGLEPVPVGVPGELFLGGAYLARGYQGRPDITAERFVPDPFGPPGARLYRTGDLVRHRDDGDIEFLGRTDHQVKVRGVRIELGEIEARLRAHESVRDCAVVAHEFAPGDVRLVGYCAVREPVDPAEHGDWSEAVRRHLAAELPPAMIPPLFVALDALPLTASNKVDRKRLPAPVRPEAAAVDRAAPDDPMAAELLSIAGALLSETRLSLDDDFFALGGHSMLAVRLLSRLSARFGVRLPLDCLFEAPTFAALLERLRAGGEAGTAALTLLRPGGPRTPAFWIHPVGGGLLCYRTIVGELPGDRAHHGLGSPGLRGDARPEELAELARAYADEIVAAAPEGPVALVGWSFGGLVAHEMARQLEERGRTVTTVILIDAAPDPAVEGEPDAGSVAAELDALVAAELDPSLGPDEHARVVAELRRNVLASRHHRPRPRAGRAVLIEAIDRTGDPIAPGPPLEEIWRGLALGGVEHHRVDGDHYQLLAGPHVRTVAAIVAAALSAADPDRSG